ncbi:MAG: membrane protein insertase YidC [Planctomycetaceae bacterium]|nr:membrane protein insertase YidC [Planctomycetaceae bacterium]
MDKNQLLRFLLIMAMMMLGMQIVMRFFDIGPEEPVAQKQQLEQQAAAAMELETAATPIIGAEQDEQIIAIGSYDPAAAQKYIAYFSNRGAALERLELVERSGNDSDDLKYGVIEFKHGYLGYLAATDNGNPPGAKIRVVADGTPAALATTESGITGLQVGDIITRLAGHEITTVEDLHNILLQETNPAEEIDIEVVRDDNLDAKLTFTTKLGQRPLEIIDPDPDTIPFREAPYSFLTSLVQVNNTTAALTQSELDNIASMRHSIWDMQIDNDANYIEFTLVVTLPPQETAATDATSEPSDDNKEGSTPTELKISKRFTLADPENALPYHLDLDLAFTNLSNERQSIVFRQDGANNIINETWWTSTSKKRDIKWKINGEEDDVRGTDIVAFAQDNIDSPFESLLNPSEPGDQSYQYIVSDSQFFAVGFSVPLSTDDPESAKSMVLKKAHSFPAETSLAVLATNKKSVELPNTSFFVQSKHIILEPNARHSQHFQVFAGPKSDEVLANYGMDGLIEYGWFRSIALVLGGILSFFYSIFGNYGIAIILLTVLVRACLHPLSRKQVRGAQMMGFLKPQMKRIGDKYKDDPQKKSLKTQELFGKYGYNPLSGCLPVFFQMPIFFGLYRSIMVNTELRGEPLLDGLNWCANLAGPDMLVYWGEQSAIFINRGGFLGPYLNLLPMITVALFMLQQKIYAPPTTDDTQQMAQKMMKFMMLFMGIMFFRVASGLCIYFIASSTWGLLERKMLPKVSDPDAYLEALAEKQKNKKKKPGFMHRMAQMAEQQKRQQAKGGDNDRRKQLDNLKGNRRRRR